MVNPQKSFFSFEKQGIRKSFKGDRTDSYQGPKFSRISITPKSAVTIEPPKKVGSFFFFFLSIFHFYFFPLIDFFLPLRKVRSLFGHGWGGGGYSGVSYASLDRARAVSARGSERELNVVA